MRGGIPNEIGSTSIGYALTRPLGGHQPNMMMGPSSPASPWQYHSIIPKQEPMDHEEHNDFGLSGSSSSSQTSHKNIPYTAAGTFQSMGHSSFSSRTLNPTSPMQIGERKTLPTHMYDIPLTPPDSEPMASPNNLQNVASVETGAEASTLNRVFTQQTTLTPVASPTERNDPKPGTSSDYSTDEDPLRSLQMLERNGFFPSMVSPKLSEGSGEDESKSENDPEECDDALRIPKVNSHGKVKTHKCKQCDFVAYTKLAHWEHNKTHIKPEKQLKCPKCPFITEYKHHLEYHINNHLGSKPYKCNQCDYCCVNKSMLNSHLKSHSNVYQYRCANCSYATKYCHSLKLHLRKYKHEPAMVLNPDGTPNPLPIVDVYGTRRGPKIKIQESKPKEETISKPDPPLQNVPYPLSQFMLNVPPQLQLPLAGYPYFAGLPEALSSALLLRNLQEQSFKLAMAQQENAQNNVEASSSISNDMEALDLSKPEESTDCKDRERRTSNSDSSEDEEGTTMFSNVEVVDQSEAEENVSSHNNNKVDYNCQYCEISFGDPILYTMHMGYHGYQNPFVCNMCGEQCKDKVSFFLHIARNPHA